MDLFFRTLQKPCQLHDPRKYHPFNDLGHGFGRKEKVSLLKYSDTMPVTTIQQKTGIKMIRWPKKTFITHRETVSFDKLPDFFTRQFNAIYGAIEREGLQVEASPCAIYYNIDEQKKEADLAAAVPVQGTINKEIEGFEKMVIPASNAFKAIHKGSFDTMSPTYEAMEKKLQESGRARRYVIEEFLSDLEVEKNPGQWVTNVYYVLGSNE